MSKKTLVILGMFFCAVVISRGIMTRGKNDELLNQLAEERSAESTVPFEEQLTFLEDDYVQKNFPKELIEYLGTSLSEEKLTECLLGIQAEYEVLSDKEKIKIIKNSSNNTLACYQYFMGASNDVWYKVSLKKEDDIVIKHLDKKNTIINYFFENDAGMGKTYEPALRAGGQTESTPYFICWDDKNYMAIPYWNIEETRITGVTVYDYSTLSVAGIGINSNREIRVCYQVYNGGGYDGTCWPVVYTE